MSQKIDYTTWRKGAIVSFCKDGSIYEKIGICPECGKKGAIRAAFYDKDGVFHPQRIIHREYVIYGCLIQIDEVCDHYEAFDGLIEHATERSRKARQESRGQIPDSDWPALPLV